MSGVLFFMKNNQKIGSLGENIAKKFLEDKGYKIIDMNVKMSYKELDLIAKHKGKIIFVEVKTRTSSFLGSADGAMSSKKIKNLKKAMGMYVSYKQLDPENVRLDLIAIDMNFGEKNTNIKHYEDIF